MNELKDQPFFLAVGFIKPHLPFAAPRKYWSLYERNEIVLPTIDEAPKNAPILAQTDWWELRHYHGIPKEGPLSDSLARTLIHGYYAAVSYVDAQVGLVLDELERLGLKDKTIVVLWGDHGWKLGEYGQWCKHTNYQLDIRSPLILSVPGMKAKGKFTDALVELIDIYPTLAELAGQSIPVHNQGKSFAPLLQKPELPWKEAVFSQYPKGDAMGYSMKTKQFHLIRWQDVKQPEKVHAIELYDHAQDPMETVNVAELPEYEKTLEQLNQMLDRGWANFN